jgi:outer membrane protein assembly factor BamE (lipoprotein component of BamABCDE complex)
MRRGLVAMNFKLRKYLIVLCVFLTGCTCGTGRTVLKQENLTEATNKINPMAKTIRIGMTKEQVIEAWGNADRVYEKQWEYSNDAGKTYVRNATSYMIVFENEKVIEIIERALSPSKFGCAQIDM